MRRISRLDLLPYRSEIVLAVVAGPFLLPRGTGRKGRPTEGGRWLERGGGRTLPRTKKDHPRDV